MHPFKVKILLNSPDVIDAKGVFNIENIKEKELFRYDNCSKIPGKGAK